MSLTHSSEPLPRFCPTRRPLSCGSSIKPDASMSCRFSKSEGIIAMSDGDQRSMHGTGHLETCIFTDSPGCRVLASWPSIETSAGARELACTCGETEYGMIYNHIKAMQVGSPEVVHRLIREEGAVEMIDFVDKWESRGLCEPLGERWDRQTIGSKLWILWASQQSNRPTNGDSIEKAAIAEVDH
jgi:hypothetical protein